MEPLTYIPLVITTTVLAVISFMKARGKDGKKRKLYWIITAFIFWIGTLLWTLDKLRVFSLWR